MARLLVIPGFEPSHTAAGTTSGHPSWRRRLLIIGRCTTFLHDSRAARLAGIDQVDYDPSTLADEEFAH